MSTEITLLILAAGKGSRYGSEKQFDPIGSSGEYLFEYIIYDAIQIGFGEVVVVTSKVSKPILEDYLNSRIPKDISVKCIEQEIDDIPPHSKTSVKRTQPWGTAHAVWCARKEIVGPFVTANADDYYGKEALAEAFKKAISLPSKGQYGLVAYPLKNTLSQNGTVSRGVCEHNENQLFSIEEFTQLSEIKGVIADGLTKKQFSGNELVSMNLWVLTPKIFRAIDDQFSDFIKEAKDLLKEELYLPSIIQSQIKSGEANVDVANSHSHWMGMTYTSDRKDVISTVKEYVESGLYPLKLW